jgi:hypothetical protein
LLLVESYTPDFKQVKFSFRNNVIADKKSRRTFLFDSKHRHNLPDHNKLSRIIAVDKDVFYLTMLTVAEIM